MCLNFIIQTCKKYFDPSVIYLHFFKGRYATFAVMEMNNFLDLCQDFSSCCSQLCWMNLWFWTSRCICFQKESIRLLVTFYLCTLLVLSRKWIFYSKKYIHSFFFYYLTNLSFKWWCTNR